MSQSTEIWMPLYVADYLAGTQHLSAEQSGAYLHLLMHEWRNGPLPLDDDGRRRIARIERDAWGNAWAVLEHFFTKTDSGYYQKRLEREREIAESKREKAVERSSKAAHARWHPARSNAQALHEECPSPSPSPTPKEKVQKPSRAKRESDPRHAEFQGGLKAYWSAENGGRDMPWGGGEGKQLRALLDSNPSMTFEDLKTCLRNRAKSGGVNHAERPRTWLSRLTDYAGGPLDRYNKPIMTGERNASFKGRTESSIDAARAAIQAIEDRAIVGEARRPSTSEISNRGLSRLCDGS